MRTDLTLLASLDRGSASQTERALKLVLILVGGSLLLALSARVQVPMWPVPMTLQSLAVLLVAMTLGARLALGVVAAYLVQGALGLPVFASGAGLAYLAGPTGGFLIGFAALAAVSGWMADRGLTRTLSGALATAICGSVALYLVGAGWLALLIGLEVALSAGVMPFLPGDVVKIVSAALLVSGAWSGLRRNR